MAIGTLVREQDSQVETLRERLTQEWVRPSPDAQPVLIEAPGNRMGDSRHLYVIWDDWHSLDQKARSEIVMDAYEATHPREEVLRVTVAMGLTPAEADHLNIHYTTGAGTISVEV